MGSCHGNVVQPRSKAFNSFPFVSALVDTFDVRNVGDINYISTVCFVSFQEDLKSLQDENPPAVSHRVQLQQTT